MFRPWFAKLAVVRMSLAARRGHTRWLRLESLESRDVPSAPAGPEFRVNTLTSGNLVNPSVATDADGNFVVVWASKIGPHPDDVPPDKGVVAQRYAADGTPLGGPIQISGAPTYGFNPKIAMDPAGDFVVAWEYFGVLSDTTHYVAARQYHADGTPKGIPFSMPGELNDQTFPSVAIDATGNFVVVWQINGQIEAQRYAADGSPQGSTFKVDGTTSGQSQPSVGMDSSGDFVVTWTTNANNSDIQARRFTAAGTPSSDPFTVNTYTPDVQSYPAIAVNAAGNFVVAWHGIFSTHDIFAQRYAANGTPQGGEFRVNTYKPDDDYKYRYAPSIAVDPAGNFVVAWESFGQDGSSYGVYAQRYKADGTPRGTEFLVNTYVPGQQMLPAVATHSNGNFVVVWQSYTQNVAGGFGVYAQRYRSLAPTDIGLSNATVAENAGANAVVGTLSATDPDVGDTATFTLVSGTGSTDNARFNVSDTQLRAKASFDFETKTSYSVRLRVTDADGLTFEKPFTITVTDVNDAPTLGGLAAAAYTENAVLLLAQSGTAADVDSPDFDNGKLTVTITANAGANDRLAVRNQGTGAGQVGVSGSNVTYGGVVIGTVSGGTSGNSSLVVAFNDSATPAKAQAVLRNVTFQLLNENPTILTRNVRYTLTDGDGGTSVAVNQAVNIVPVNDAPTMSGIATPIAYTENASLLLAPNGTVTDLDSANFDMGKLTVTLTANAGANDRLAIRHQGTAAGQVGVNGITVSVGGVAVGTYAGGVGTAALVITFNASATPARVQAVLRNFTYQLLFDNPTLLTRTVRYTLTDGDGGTSAVVNQTVNIVPVNDAPTLGGITGPKTYNALAAPLVLAPTGTVADVDSPNFDGGKLTVRLAMNGGSSDRLAVRNQGTGAGQISVSGTTIVFGGVAIGTFTGGSAVASPLVIAFNASATAARVQAVLRNITYSNVSATPATAPRTVRFTLSDGDGGMSAAVDQIVNVVIP